jgi:hypothetical protein
MCDMALVPNQHLFVIKPLRKLAVQLTPFMVRYILVQHILINLPVSHFLISSCFV